MTSLTGIVFDIQRYSIHDGPGIRTTVFLKGCPLRCLWCHNPEGQATAPEEMRFPDRCIGCGACERGLPCPTGARRVAGQAMTVAEVMREIEKDIMFFDESGGGVTFSGGEPLMQAGFLIELLKACRQREIRTAIETSGCGRPEDVAEAARHADLWLYDLKLVDDARHRQYVGATNAVILDNLRLLASLGVEVIVRIPIIPGVNDDEANLAASGELIAGLPTVREVHVLPYHSTGSDKYRRLGLNYLLTETPEPDAEHMGRIAARLAAHGLRVKIGG